MTCRTIDAEQDEIEERGHRGQECGAAEDSQRTDKLKRRKIASGLARFETGALREHEW